MLETFENKCFVVKISGSRPPGRYQHKFGGFPDGFEKYAVPKCINCQQPLHLFFQVDMSDPLLGGGRPFITYIYIFNCLNCDSYWTPLYYRIDPQAAVIKILTQAASDHFGEYPPVLPEGGIVFEPLNRRSWPQEPVRRHQFGGQPHWIRAAQRPDCRVCGRPMNFIAQVDSDDRLGIMFGDMGLLYAFVCENCRVFATFVQCH